MTARTVLSASPPAACVWAALLLFTLRPALAQGPRVAVVRVVDGDTMIVRKDGRTATVRLLGVDTPERGRNGHPDEPYAGAATRFAQKRLRRAARITLEVAGDRLDDHGRTLGFLWLSLPGRREPVNLSEELILAGLARAIRFFDYPRKDYFLELEADARRQRRGIWSHGRDR